MKTKRIRMMLIGAIILSAFAFIGCNNIKHENGLNFHLNTTTQEYTVYAGGNLGENVVIPATFKNKPVTKIRSRGFSNNANLGSYRVGKTDHIKSIFIPSSIKEIPYDTFEGCAALESIVVAQDNPIYKSDGNCLIETATNILITGCVTSIIPDYITEIIGNSFLGTKLWNDAPNNSIVYVSKWVVGIKGNIDKSIVLNPDTVGLGNGAFWKCYQLENIILSSTLKYIGESAFFECVSLKEIVIPLSVIYISYDVFKDCRALATIYVEAEEKPDGWVENWAPDKCTVVWGYKG